MKLTALIIFSVISLCTFADEKEYCHYSPMNPVSIESLDLLNSLHNILGVSPMFCRSTTASSDDLDDVRLKELVEKLTSRVDGPEVLNQTESIKRVLKITAMKKLWSLVGENTRMSIYLSKECEGYEFNKWPVFSEREVLYSGDDKKAAKAYQDFIKICSTSISNNELAPYLSKDVLTEALVVLTKIYPLNYGSVKKYICDFFASTPEVVFRDTVYENFVLRPEIENAEEFSRFLMLTNKDLLTYYQLQAGTGSLKNLLSKEEYQAISNYTEKNYVEYNTCLREPKTCTSSSKWGIEQINSALVKIRNASKNTKKEIYFRGAHSLKDPVLKIIRDAIASGKPVVLDPAFLSSTGQSAISKRFAGHYSPKDVDGIIFVIKSKKCAGISEISGWGEDEFLCPPGMKFKIRETGVKIPVEPGIGGWRPGELPHSPSKVYYLDEVE